jgi:hypothetical protein
MACIGKMGYGDKVPEWALGRKSVNNATYLACYVICFSSLTVSSQIKIISF